MKEEQKKNATFQRSGGTFSLVSWTHQAGPLTYTVSAIVCPSNVTWLCHQCWPGLLPSSSPCFSSTVSPQPSASSFSSLFFFNAHHPAQQSITQPCRACIYMRAYTWDCLSHSKAIPCRARFICTHVSLVACLRVQLLPSPTSSFVSFRFLPGNGQTYQNDKQHFVKEYCGRGVLIFKRCGY